MKFYKLALSHSMCEARRVNTAGGVFSPHPADQDVRPNKTAVELWIKTSGLPISPCTKKNGK